MVFASDNIRLTDLLSRARDPAMPSGNARRQSGERACDARDRLKATFERPGSAAAYADWLTHPRKPTAEFQRSKALASRSYGVSLAIARLARRCSFRAERQNVCYHARHLLALLVA
jgi:hypothetical protein